MKRLVTSIFALLFTVNTMQAQRNDRFRPKFVVDQIRC